MCGASAHAAVVFLGGRRAASSTTCANGIIIIIIHYNMGSGRECRRHCVHTRAMTHGRSGSNSPPSPCKVERVHKKNIYFSLSRCFSLIAF